MKIHLENKHFDFPIAEIFNIFMNYEYIRSNSDKYITILSDIC